MKHEFAVGDHVEWNSEAGHVRGTIKKKLTAPITFKGYTVRADRRSWKMFAEGVAPPVKR